MTYEYLKENGLILLEVIVGSQAYGTATPASDIDRKFVYILPEEDILGNKYVEQITVNKDFAGYEIKRFLELLAVGNPTMLELIAGDYPKDCILYKHPAFDLILNEKDKFITKLCQKSFGGYAKQQISKAEGLNKMQNWEIKRVTRKTPIDFCYVIMGEKSLSLKKVLINNKLDQKFCGLVNVPHVCDVYALFYDEKSAKCFSELYSESERNSNKKTIKKENVLMGFGYKGIQMDDSNKIRLSSIPKGQKSLFNIYYNENGYSQHAKKWNQYQVWLKNRNESRYTDAKAHGQRIDGKNMLHCRRLLDMAREIAEGKGINVQRQNFKELLKIRRGEIDLKSLILYAENEIQIINKLFDKSNLPSDVNQEFIHELLVKIRIAFY